MPEALVVKAETVEAFVAMLQNLPELKTGYVRLLGPRPGFIYERQFHTKEEETAFLVEFGLGRLRTISPEYWVRRRGGGQFNREMLDEAKHLLAWAREYYRLARDAAAQ